ncbi:hypothetical protein SAMN05446037_101675 [Anaerovirgula multivorans]|uniref:Secreted protein n=1 Tax=Anaerovirgula multivorans TaxID=312168 RepID=A0A239GEU7_9FIRM|nr:hypothetical protein [Anaerovirgula multivorans]SNS67561.1 hypothetical protein SAMN05446037_101675 [Anaerovirgula multivorans]
MKKMFKCFAFGLVLITCVFLVQNVSALANEIEEVEEDREIKESLFIYSYKTTLNVSDDKATVSYQMQVKQGSTCYVSLELQYYENGEWKRLTSWSDSSSNVNLFRSKSCNIYKNKTYRVKATYRALFNGVYADTRSEIIY